MTHHIDVDEFISSLELKVGGHNEDSGEFCINEAVAYIAGEPWTDRPACMSPVIAAFTMTWQDDLDDESRQKLKPFIPRLAGTNTGEAGLAIGRAIGVADDRELS